MWKKRETASHRHVVSAFVARLGLEPLVGRSGISFMGRIIAISVSRPSGVPTEGDSQSRVPCQILQSCQSNFGVPGSALNGATLPE
jgi:hypothetical protein